MKHLQFKNFEHPIILSPYIFRYVKFKSQLYFYNYITIICLVYPFD